MKKLLVLMLVFGLTSAANAAVVGLSVDGSTVTTAAEIDIASPTIILSVVSDTDDHPWLMEVSVAMADATLGAPTPTSNAGGLADYVDYSGGGLWDYELSTAGSPGSVLKGQQWTMNLTALGGLGSVFTVSLGEYGATPVSTIDFTVVPEPMTIALLGLGSLFMLRRRK
jgi:hypothetical protein